MTSSTEDGLRICVHWSIAADTTSTSGRGSVTAGSGGIHAVLGGEQLAERHRLVERSETELRQDPLRGLGLQERGERGSRLAPARASPTPRRAP